MKPELPAAAKDAWNAYLAMCKSKDAHFELLETLETREKEGGFRTVAEKEELARRLSDHDTSVKQFKHELVDLQTRDPSAHAAVLSQLQFAHKDSANDQPI